jgi:hypothetical protein
VRSYKDGELTNRDVIVVVDGNQVPELQVTSNAGSLAGNSFLCASVTEEHVGVVVKQVVTGLVELGSGVCLGDGETDRIGKALAKRTGGDFDTGSVMGLRVTRCDAVYFLEFAQLAVHRAQARVPTRKDLRSSMVTL